VASSFICGFFSSLSLLLHSLRARGAARSSLRPAANILLLPLSGYVPIGKNLKFLINFIYLLIYILDSLLVACVYRLLGFFVLIVGFFCFDWGFFCFDCWVFLFLFYCLDFF
jgi:hypothetical protein